VEFLDVAGLVRNANEGEGLGNEFLGQIRDVDAVCHVLRVFEDTDISHVEGSIDPVRDRGIIETEFMLADLEVVEKRLEGLEKKARVGDAEDEFEFFKAVQNDLKAGRRPSFSNLSDDQVKWLKEVSLLSTKPVLYVLNTSEEMIGREEEFEKYREAVEAIEASGHQHVTVCADVEHELALMDESERDLFLDDYGLSEPGLHRLIRAAYRTLNQVTYFTYNENELRGWSIEEGSTAPEAAGQIHSDFEEGFIRAETVNFEDFKEYRSWKEAKSAGAVRSRGEDYVVQDGDILLFQFDA
jgi:GTP-binding protein YchF